MNIDDLTLGQIKQLKDFVTRGKIKSFNYGVVHGHVFQV